MPQLLPRARASQESVFARMSRLAAQYGAVNLGQGFPADAPRPFCWTRRGGRWARWTSTAHLPACPRCATPSAQTWEWTAWT
ncbi:hypothetical protein ACFP9V_08510 [Deinococcus radiopugnans]|uniref:hypothetical protein n=1 Tax=Deinococcus radiopugnans TaxID=57497 RepID=UPI003616B07E